MEVTFFLLFLSVYKSINFVRINIDWSDTPLNIIGKSYLQ